MGIPELIETQMNFNTCLADVREGIRSNGHFQSIRFLQFDFDKVDVAPDDMSNMLQGVKHYILTSKSDDPNGKRHYHLFVPVNTITSNEVYQDACDTFLDTHPLPCERDEKAKDSVRLFFKHKGTGSINLGKGIPLFEFQHFKKKKETTRIVIPYCGDVKHLSNKGAAWAIDCYCKKHNMSFDLVNDGKRWKGMHFVTGTLRLMGIPDNEILDYLDSHSNYEKDSSKQFTRDKVVRFLEGTSKK
jgi:hypothetical protein